MFIDHKAWPPPPDGPEPDKPRPAMSAREERMLLSLIGILLMTIFIAPFSGSSVVAGVFAVLSDW